MDLLVPKVGTSRAAFAIVPPVQLSYRNQHARAFGRTGMTDGNTLSGDQLRLIVLNCVYVAACCLSIVLTALAFPEYHILFDARGAAGAIIVVLTFAAAMPLFALAPFSFGYMIGFYLYIMVAGYLWLNAFSEFAYDHTLTGLSAVASALAFLFPALFISSPLRQVYVLSPKAVDRVLVLILALSVATIAVGASYNFMFVDLENIYTYRDKLDFPRGLLYLFGITSNALLPFAFAMFVEKRAFWRAVAVLLLLMLFYPVTLTKTAFFAPAWLVVVLVASRFFESKTTLTVTMLVPVAIGLVLLGLYNSGAIGFEAAPSYFKVVNLRMIAIPSLAMDYYNFFFARHDLTFFCQIRVVKAALGCGYQDELPNVIYNAFGIGGNFNASLFSTEGIASVGPFFAPLSTLICGLIFGLGNRMSAGLPPRLILISGALATQTFLNLPLTIGMVTYGGALLFLLWYVTPRTIFEPRT
jgi:hypothetical protein